jgi:hypothetical protein
LAVLTPVGSGAWSNGGYSSDTTHPDYGTHDWIADAALELQTRDASFLSSDHHGDYLLGSEAPDNPSYFGDTSKHHVYYRSSGALQDDSAGQRAQQMYRTALQYLKSGNEKDAAFYAGAMTHYIADMAVFGHTMGSSTDWGSEAVHQDYEDQVDNDIVGMSFPASLPLTDLDAYNSTLGLAFRVTFGAGGVKPNTWMDDNYDWTNSAYRAAAFAAVNEAVSAVAASINHLLMESDAGPPPEEEPVHPTADRTWVTAGIIAAAAAIAAASFVVVRALTRR